MAKITEESTKDLSLNESDEMEVAVNDDVMSDISPEDYVFVVTQEGVLKGISLPEVDIIASPKVEEIFKFFINRDGGALSSRTIH
jgi:hypothetical protein